MLTVEDRLEIMDVEGTLSQYTEDGVIEGFYSTGEVREMTRRDLPAIFEGEGTLKRHLAPNL